MIGCVRSAERPGIFEDGGSPEVCVSSWAIVIPSPAVKLWNVLGDVVTERELPVLRKQQNGCGGKLSGEAAGVELRVRRHRYVFVEVGEPKTACVDDPAVLYDSDGEAGRAPRMDLRLRHLVDPGGKRRR